MRRSRRKADDLVPTQGLEKWLKGAGNQAAQGGAVDVDLADSGGTLDLPGGRRSDETNLHSLSGQLVCHAPQPTDPAER